MVSKGKGADRRTSAAELLLPLMAIYPPLESSGHAGEGAQLIPLTVSTPQPLPPVKVGARSLVAAADCGGQPMGWLLRRDASRPQGRRLTCGWNRGEARRHRGAATAADDRPMAPEALRMAKLRGLLVIGVADGRGLQLKLGRDQSVGVSQGTDIECAVCRRQHEKTENDCASCH